MQHIGNRVVVPPPIDARANSRELLESLGYKVLRASDTRRHAEGATRFRRSGGKRNGYCPVID
jgi:hypothetical protein